MTFIHNLNNSVEAEINQDDFWIDHPLKNVLEAEDFSFDLSIHYYQEEGCLEINGEIYDLSPSAKKWFDEFEHQLETVPFRKMRIRPIHLVVIHPKYNEDPNTTDGWIGTWADDEFIQGE